MNPETLPAQGPVDVNVSRQCTCHPDDNPPTPCEHRYAFRDCADAAEERYLRETLAMLQESYAKAAKPYMDRLVALHSRSLPQMLVTVEQAQALGLLPSYHTRPALRAGEPCDHPGCLSHVSHPCEGCGRIAGRTQDATPPWRGFQSQYGRRL